jgi:linoleoyl-CoA desaturase
MTETITRKQSVVDELWKRANQLIENYDGEMFGSNVIINMNMRILEDKLMTSNEFHSWAYDEDLEAGRILRFSKHAEWRKHHKYQHIYSVLLYGLLTFNWSLTTDFTQMYRYVKRGLSYGKFPKPIWNWSTLVITKIIYFSIWLVIPMVFLDTPWYMILLGFFVMHYVAGLILSMVFQLAHVIDQAETPLPDDTGNMKNTWAIHQLYTTVNFGRKNRLMNWFTGGLNHQVEHHIFPNISHIHYTKISKIVKETAMEFNLPYNEYKTTRKAIISHFKHLRDLGKNPALNY